MAATNPVYVITGANRGIGLGLLQAYLARPSTTVVGIVRSAEAAAALEEAAQTVTKGAGSTYYVAIVDFTKSPSPTVNLELLRTAVNGAIDHVDTLICSAGHAGPFDPALTMKPSDLRDAFEVNAIGPLSAFQALWPLLQKSATPKFVVLSSSLGSIGQMEPVSGGGYGPSKAAVNHIIMSIHQQLQSSGIVSIALHPGWVQTAMGYATAEAWGYAPGPTDTLEDSVNGIVKVVDEATRETVSGKFVAHTGDLLVW